jgi:adenylate cyclase
VAAVEGTEEIDLFLRSLGASDQQLATAWRDCRIASLAADLVLAAGATLTAADLAVRAGVSEDAVLSLWRTLGVVVPDSQRPMFSESDAAFTSFAARFDPAGLGGAELMRVLGSSLARVAEAAVSLYVQTVEPSRDLPEADLLEWSEELVEATTAALKLGDSMGAIFSHHMRGAIDRQRVAQSGVTDRSLYRLAVGFVDLVGFTPLSLHTAPSKLLELISVFESEAFEVASSHNGRIVKHIGDEVMFVALDAAAGCAIARDITAAYAEGIEPRAGVAFGDVITRHGDYYGSVVNLAARLAELAVPKEVLVDGATASSATGSFSFRPAGHRLLKGFDRPLEVFSLLTDASPATVL